ncbi:MAG: hypothetical protein QM645_14150 [Asticcacaulis sp.]
MRVHAFLVDLTVVQRAALSHIIRNNQTKDREPFCIDVNWISVFPETARLPSFQEQVSRLIRIIGDDYSLNGRAAEFVIPIATAKIGCINSNAFHDLIDSVVSADLVSKEQLEYSIGSEGQIVDRMLKLTYAGWARYELEKRGELSGRYGFMAMKFDDPVLQPLFRDTIKPRVKEATGYDVVEVREKTRAGVIDNIIREEIRNAAFVLADLSHGNNGAYWEAGYAEGMGKPVIYLCEQKTFDETKTHFDTNHCTTVMWSKGNEELFAEQLIATIQRSLSAGLVRGTA